jgi:sulfur-oxidizing protein SoxX
LSIRAGTSLALLLFGGAVSAADNGAFVPWQAKDLAIAEPLAGLQGNPERGRDIVRRKDKGNCLACHVLPIPEEPFHGTVGPPLDSVGARLTAAQLRLRVADESQVVPTTVMPPFHRDPQTIRRPAQGAIGKPVLSAQEVEDVVAYLVTLQ